MLAAVMFQMGLTVLPGCGERDAGANKELPAMALLREGFVNPPPEARPRAFWDWVDGNYDLEEITREMEEAARMGLGGFDLWDVRSVVDEDRMMPAGPAFMSDAYLEAIAHAIREAGRNQLALGLIVSSGWNSGGAWTLPEHQTMGLFKSELQVAGPGEELLKLPFPELPDMAGKPGRQTRAIIPRGEDGLPKYYKDVCVIAYRDDPGGAVDPQEVADLSRRMNKEGSLKWEVPAGSWKVVRYVCTNTGQPMISSTPNSHGPMIDHFSAGATERHIRYFLDRIENALGRSVGESGLSYLYTDSYEIQGQLWTPLMAAEFEQRMGYSMIPYLPALEGVVMGDGSTTRRFLYDYRRLLSDLIIENHYALSRRICEEHGIGFVAEAAGPGWPVHNCPFESIKSSGSLTYPRGEFWHVPDNNPFWKRVRNSGRGSHWLDSLQVIKGVASASHLYNQKYVEAEAFTGTHLWNEGPGDLKPTADRAFCEGLNRIVFHTWPHTPEEAGEPGWVYAFGTLVNENRIWWPMAKPFMEYIGRCSFMLQQGQFVGDLLFYYGDSVPNFVPAKHPVPGLGPGYDYDVTNTDILLNVLEVKDGKLTLPHGPSYEVLVLPDESYMQPEVLAKVAELVRAGAVVAGPRPYRSHGLHNREERDRNVQKLADDLWGECDGKTVTRNDFGSGRVYWGAGLGKVMEERQVMPDLVFDGPGGPGAIDFIHRRWKSADLYFIRNTTEEPLSGTIRVRQSGKSAELWDPASGIMYRLEPVPVGNGRSGLTISLEEFGSLFLVFHPETFDAGLVPDASKLPPAFSTEIKPHKTMELKGSWDLHFPEENAGIGEVVFDSLVYWNERPEDEIRFFSGIATYRKEMQWDPEVQQGDGRVFLDLGTVIETARVSLNGRELGILWKPPFRMEVTGALKQGANLLEVEVANTWANGLAGDARLPGNERRTKTNVTRLPNAWTYPMESIPNDEYDLLESGLAGPVTLSIWKITTNH